MIMSVEEYRTINPKDTDPDSTVEMKLLAVESAIRAYTNNNFTKRGFRFHCPVYSGKLFFATNYISPGDTLQITDSALNDGVYYVMSKTQDEITLNEKLYDEDFVMVTKVFYPPDVKLGAAKLLEYDLEHRGKTGISSETISRHSVTYFNMDGQNSDMGYPKSLLGFLNPHMKARF